MEEGQTFPLSGFQQWMQQLLLDPYQPTGGNPQDLPSSTFGVSPVESVINHSARLSAQEHLAIYQRSYIARLRSCMAQQFSALEYALGEELFRAFADDYLASFPSTHYNLSELGRQFSAYLQANRPDALSEEKEDWIDFVIELAEFEYAIGELFDRQADESYQLAEMNDEDDEIELVPTCTLFRFHFPSNTFYTRFKKGECPDLPFAAASYCVVVRHQYKLAVYELQPDHYEFLALLTQGVAVSAAKAMFCQLNHIDGDAFARMWPVWKQNWVEAHLFKVRSKTQAEGSPATEQRVGKGKVQVPPVCGWPEPSCRPRPGPEWEWSNQTGPAIPTEGWACSIATNPSSPMCFLWPELPCWPSRSCAMTPQLAQWTRVV